MSSASTRARIPPWIGYAAAAWAFSHGALSVYWALGGTAGTELLSESIREQATGGLLFMVWATGAAKLGAGLLALALIRPGRWPWAVRKWLIGAAWIGGAILTLYGALGIAVSAAVVTALIDASDDASATVRRAYLLLWYPLWLLGGLLFLATARRASQQQP